MRSASGARRQPDLAYPCRHFSPLQDYPIIALSVAHGIVGAETRL